MKQIQIRAFFVWTPQRVITSVAALVLLVFIISSVSSTAQTAETPSTDVPVTPTAIEQVEDELIVKYTEGSEPESSANQHAGLSIASIDQEQTQEIGNTGYWKQQVPEGQTVEQAIEELEQDPTVESAEPNRIRRMTVTPDDTYLSLQLHLLDAAGGIDAYDAWDIGTGSSDVVVAVIDTGVDTDHEDLAANMWTNTGEIASNGIDDDGNGYVDDVYGYDFVDDDNDPNPSPNGLDDDDYGGADTGITHGTHVAGIVAAVGNNTTGVTGVAWTASIMALQVLDDEGIGADADISEAVEYAADNGADIIQMSLGGYGSTSVLEDAIEYAAGKGVPIIAATGNDGININNDPFYPACYDDVLGVASVDANDAASYFTNYGTNCADLSAPGEFVLSTLYTDDATYGFTTDYDYMSGTSMATPSVSGVAALILGQDDTIERDDLYSIITSTTEDVGLAAKYGSGRLDAEAALLGMDIASYPSTPGNLQAYGGSSKGTEYEDGDRTTDTTPYFTWDASTDDVAVTGYYVYFGTDNAADPETAGTLQTERTYEPTVSEGNEVSYHLRIKATDDEGNTSLTAASFEYIVDTTVTKPKKVTATRTSNGVKVTWKKVTGEHVNKYKVLRKNLSKKKGKYKVIKSLKSSKTQYIDKSVKPNKTYRYKVRAVDDLKNKKVSKNKKVTFYPRDRLVVTAGDGGGPVVGIYNVKTKEWEQAWYAFKKSSYFGLEVAVGNFDKDSKDEIVTAPTSGSSKVRILEAGGKKKKTFYAYGKDFTGGVRVAAGDVDNDGVDEIITAPGPGGGPHIKVFEKNGKLKWDWMALDGAFTGGAFVTAVNWDGKGRDEIAVSAGEGGGPTVYIYNPKTGARITSFTPYASEFTGGVRVATSRLKNETKEAVVTVPESGATQVQKYKKKGSSAKKVNGGFYAFVQTYTEGGIVAAGDLYQKNKDNLMIGSNGVRMSTVQIYNNTGKTLKKTLYPFGSYYGAVHVASGWVY